MRPLRTYNVRPRLPERIARLAEIAQGFWYDWDYDALSLFLRLDRDLWESSGHNPVRMLGLMPQDALEALADDDGFVAQCDRVCRAWDAYLTGDTWAAHRQDLPSGTRIACFSLEFGVSECIPIYSGGLGVLAGDHIKAASDLGLPLVGVGNLWQQGYFRQYLNSDGWQGELYPDNDFFTMPLHLERTPDGQPLVIRVDFPVEPAYAQVWRVRVGRVAMVMLDTNIPRNARREYREITYQLYGGDIENRIRQEIMLGVGGLRALEALGLRPTICHLNEGHSAFLTLERVRQRMVEDKLSFDEALEATRAGNIFTTHTPVPAGNEIFPAHMVERYVRALFDGLDVPMARVLELGRAPGERAEGFGMTVFAIHMSSRINGVSRLHGEVSRDMWKGLWPHTPVEDTPIRHVTNGVHLATWISRDMADLFERYVDPEWRDPTGNGDIWSRVAAIPGEELWRVHERRRERMIAFCRRRLRQMMQRRGDSDRDLALADEILDPMALTVVFARRMATYKRGALLLRDLPRLKRLVGDPDRPVQFIFAGKAHPHDTPGKQVIREIAHAARDPQLRNHLIFLEDYDLQTARYLVQGADVWLNTPRRPLEASGTSGMKAAANGVLNVSVLDGWYDEAYREHPEMGWAIGHGEIYADHDYQDTVECDALFDILEEKVTPMFYRRGRDGSPREWIEMMKASMRVACATYNTHRMTRQYAEEFYFPAARRERELTADGCRRAKALAAWKARVREQWGKIRIEDVVDDQPGEVSVGARFTVRAQVFLGELTPDEVLIEAYHGDVDANNIIRNPTRVAMKLSGPASSGGRPIRGSYAFLAEVEARRSGRFGYSIRVLPRHPDLDSPFIPGLIVWSNPA